jgi:spore maturation protein CgeB
MFKQQINNPIYGNQYIKKIRESKIVLNLFLDGYKNFHGVNNRIFEVLTLNSFLLTQHNDGINDFFDIGSEIITFKSKKDLMDKIEFYLENDKERLLIQKRGYKRAIHYNNYNFINQLLRYSKTNL